jgi:hypothetical protein
MPKPPPEYHETYARADLPQALTREIGKIVTRWAFLEYQIQAFIWDLAGVDQRVGRLAMREPRITDRWDVMLDLAALQGVKVDTKQLSSFKTGLNELQSKRDLFAHGVWTKPKGKGRPWHVILARGNHARDVEIPHRNRRISPEGVSVSAEQLRIIADRIETATDSFRRLRGAIREMLPASGKTHQQQ